MALMDIPVIIYLRNDIVEATAVHKGSNLTNINLVASPNPEHAYIIFPLKLSRDGYQKNCPLLILMIEKMKLMYQQRLLYWIINFLTFLRGGLINSLNRIDVNVYRFH